MLNKTGEKLITILLPLSLMYGCATDPQKFVTETDVLDPNTCLKSHVVVVKQEKVEEETDDQKKSEKKEDKPKEKKLEEIDRKVIKSHFDKDCGNWQEDLQRNEISYKILQKVFNDPKVAPDIKNEVAEKLKAIQAGVPVVSQPAIPAKEESCKSKTLPSGDLAMHCY